jgi:hypothetical protein
MSWYVVPAWSWNGAPTDQVEKFVVVPTTAQMLGNSDALVRENDRTKSPRVLAAMLG